FTHFVLNDINNKTGNIINILTPSEETERGCQVSLLIPNQGKRIFEMLKKHGVITDWREPDVIRIAPVPLYNSFEDVYRFGNIIEHGLLNMN
ncbi:MAG: hypothetical protein ABIY51_12875, partial [Ferruginibacter sp.]